MLSMTDAQRLEMLRNADTEYLSTYIPDYWQAHLKGKIAHIRSLQNENTASFGLVADFHCGVNTMHTPALMGKVLADCDIPYFYNAGDFVSGMGIIAPQDLLMEIRVSRELFSRIADKQLMVLGNHDMAYSTYEPPNYYAEFLTKEDLNEHIFNPQKAYHNRTFGPGGAFYADDAAHKLRHITLNTHDTPSDEIGPDGFAVYNKFRLTGFRQDQITWFAEVALQVPDKDWTVVLCSHESLGADKGYVFYNQQLVLGILDAFRRHTAYTAETCYTDVTGYDAAISVDFTDKGGSFAAWVGGHTHKDAHLLQKGILTICSASDSLVSAPNCKASTTEEQAFDIFTIDKSAHKIHITRIGRGADREFPYDVF